MCLRPMCMCTNDYLKLDETHKRIINCNLILRTKTDIAYNSVLYNILYDYCKLHVHTSYLWTNAGESLELHKQQ